MVYISVKMSPFVALFCVLLFLIWFLLVYLSCPVYDLTETVACQVHELYKFGPLTAVLSVNYLDRFLSVFDLPVKIFLCIALLLYFIQTRFFYASEINAKSWSNCILSFSKRRLV
jgi:hypothetical protein